MSFYNCHIRPLNLSNIEWDIESFSNPNENEFDKIGDILERNLPLEEEEEEQEEVQKYEINSLNEESHEQYFLVDDDDDSKIKFDNAPMPSFKEIENILSPINPNNSLSNDSNDSNSLPESTYLFSVTKEETSSLFASSEDIHLLNGKRILGKRQRKDNRDNIYKKIKRNFFNNALINKLNSEFRNARSANYFRKFPQFFAADVTKRRNKEILDMTLLEIFKKYELYKFENEEGLSNYNHNLKVAQSEEINENERIQRILNKTFRQLYTEYINSEEFNINEIKRLRQKKMGENYIERYKNLAKNLIKFFSN